ncbi:hypothetical protein ES703_79380 [subsurface metagenome]
MAISNPPKVIIGYGRLTEEGFRFTPATGTCNLPANINDNAVGDVASFSVVDQYAEIILPACVEITQFDHYGNAANGVNGRFTISYLGADDTWYDWVTDIPTVAAAWQSWNSTGGKVTAKAIRWTMTTVDPGQGHVGEIRVKY